MRDQLAADGGPQIDRHRHRHRHRLQDQQLGGRGQLPKRRADYYLSEQGRPDVTLMPQPGLMRCAKANNQIKVLPAEVATAVSRGQANSWIAKGKVDGAPYGVVFKTGNKSRVWYNRELLTAAGVDPASLENWTWQQFLKTVSTLRSNLGHQQPALAIGAVENKWVRTDWFENIYARVVGGAYEDLAKPKPDAWKSQDVLDTLEKMTELMGRRRPPARST